MNYYDDDLLKYREQVLADKAEMKRQDRRYQAEEPGFPLLESIIYSMLTGSLLHSAYALVIWLFW